MSVYKLACDTNCVHEGAALCMLHFFMKRLAPTINARIALKSMLHNRQKDGTIFSFCKAVICFVEKYATEDVIAKTGADMTPFPQLSSKLPTEYAETL